MKEPKAIIPYSIQTSVPKIAKKLRLDNDTVNHVLSELINCITLALENEIPFYLNSFGKFYFTYEKPRQKYTYSKDKAFGQEKYYDKKIMKILRFAPTINIRNRFHEWVIDLGIKSNLTKDMIRISIKPDEIMNIRRAQLLKEQRELGFRPQLVFDNDSLPEVDKNVKDETDEIPTVSEILARLGVKVKD